MKNALVKGLVNVVATKKNTALTESMCEKLGRDVKEAFSQWKDSVDILYALACEYAEYVNDPDRTTSDQKLRDAEMKLTRQWWHCLGFGEADLLHPKMFVRPQDAETLRTWASGMVIIQTPKARAFARTGVTLFRKYVETLLMVRMTSANLISDADRDVYLEYTGLEKTIRGKKMLLNGKGETEGLKTQLEKARKSVEATRELLQKAGASEEIIRQIVAERQFKVNELVTSVKNAEDDIKLAEERKEELQKAYDSALKRINDVEEIEVK